MTETLTVPERETAVFPEAEVAIRLRRELGKLAAEIGVLTGDWEPELDSLRVVCTLVALQDLFDFKLTPEKIVRKGGYGSVEEGFEDMAINIKTMWREHYKIKA